MAKRYRYAFAKQKEAEEGIFSLYLAGISFLLFLVALSISFLYGGNGGLAVGIISVLAALLSIYGFIVGLKSFSAKRRSHTFSTAGSIANGLIMVGWLALFLIGV